MSVVASDMICPLLLWKKALHCSSRSVTVTSAPVNFLRRDSSPEVKKRRSNFCIHSMHVTKIVGHKRIVRESWMIRGTTCVMLLTVRSHRPPAAAALFQPRRRRTLYFPGRGYCHSSLISRYADMRALTSPRRRPPR